MKNMKEKCSGIASNWRYGVRRSERARWAQLAKARARTLLRSGDKHGGKEQHERLQGPPAHVCCAKRKQSWL